MLTMKMKLVNMLVLAGVLQCRSQPVPCLSDYLAKPRATIEDKCASIHTFSECIADAEKVGITVEALAQLETMLQQAQADVGSRCVVHVKPSIRTSRDGLNVKVDGSEDVIFTRFKRADVSIFALAKQVADLEATVDGAPNADDIKFAVDEGVASAVLTLSTLTKGELQDSREHFSTVVADALKSINDAASENTNTLNAAVDGIAAIKKSVQEKATKDDVEKLKEDLRSLKSQCPRGVEYETAPHTPTTDRKCKAYSVCSSKQFESAGGTADKDRVCTNLKVCSKAEFASFAGSATADRVCKTAKVCGKVEYEKTAPTETSDRVCGTGLPNCKSYYDKGERENAFYMIKQSDNVIVSLWCNMDAGGWTLVGRQVQKVCGRSPGAKDMFANGCNCGSQGRSYTRFSQCLKNCNFLYLASSNSARANGVKGDAVKQASDLTVSRQDVGFFTDRVVGTRHRMVFFANGKQAAASSRGCPAMQEKAHRGTIYDSLTIRPYKDGNNPAALHNMVQCGGEAHNSRSLWIDTGKIWGGENDEICDTNCGNGGDFGGQPRGRADEIRFWTL